MLAVPILVPTLAPIQVPMPMGSSLVQPILVVPIPGQIIQDGSKDKDSGMDGFQDGDNKDGLNKAGTHWHGDLDGGKCGDKGF
jgi:hypothetical protein